MIVIFFNHPLFSNQMRMRIIFTMVIINIEIIMKIIKLNIIIQINMFLIYFMKKSIN